MKFTTEVEITETDFKLNYSSVGVVVGSCFAQNIGEKLSQNRFKVVKNPCGASYNPLSVYRTFELITGRAEFTEDCVVASGDQFISFDHSTQFSKPTRKEAFSDISASLTHAGEVFSNSTYIIITLGTAWVYRLRDTGQVVNNCHKLPPNQFTRSLLTVSEIVEQLRKLLSWSEFQGKHVIFTVSPVRHIKETLHGNQISKATLLLAVNQLVQEFRNVEYFPAYEIVTDELRDYRYYAEDMVHPSTTAIDYIWERFLEWCLDADDEPIMKKVFKINAGLSHRPLRADSDEYRRFRAKLNEDIRDITEKYPNIVFCDFKDETL